jgi:hypothetical protein
MAYVLRLPSSNPLERPFSESLYMRSCSSFASHASAGTVRHNFPRSFSATSVRSLSSLPNGHWLPTNGNTPPRLASRSLLDLIHDFGSNPVPRRASSHVPQKASWCSYDRPPSAQDLSRLLPSAEESNDDCQDVSCQATLPVRILRTPGASQTDEFDTCQLNAPLEYACEIQDELANVDNQHKGDTPSSPDISLDERPFKHWLSTLRRRNHQKRRATKNAEDYALQDATQISNSPFDMANSNYGHKKSLSLTSSLGLITAVKSASMTLASTSIDPRSHKDRALGHVRSEYGSSRFSDVRMSLDNRHSVGPALDIKAQERSQERGSIIGEILESEESYISDMKALVNVCLVVECVP